MSAYKHLLNKFMDQFGEIKHAYRISTSKQNKVIRQFVDRVHQLDSGFMVNEDVLAILLELMPRQFRISAKEGLDARTKDACQNIFADQMDILYHCVKHGWDSCDDYPYNHCETIIFVSECMVEAIEDIGLNMFDASLRKPDKLAEGCEKVLATKTTGIAKSVCEFNSSFDPEYVTHVLLMQKSLFCDTLKHGWNQTFLLNGLNMGEHENKDDKSITSLFAPRRRERAKRRYKEAQLLKSVQERADQDVDNFLNNIESTQNAPEDGREWEEEEEQEEEQDVAADGSAETDHLSLQLFTVTDVERVLQNNKKIKPADCTILKHLCDQKGRLSMIPIPDAYQSILRRFRDRFPHMHVLADEIEANLSLLCMGGASVPLKLLPQICILDGAPGVGKTVAAAFLAKEFGTAFRIIDCAGQSNGFDITGQSSGWSSGKAGCVADILIGKQSPNAIMILDEVDKIAGSDNCPVENALYSLLESESAKRFRDEFLDFEMDASNINWFATSNYYANIPAPIRDRAKRIIIPMPDADQRKTIASYLYQDERAEKEAIWGKYFASELPDDVAEFVAAEKNISIRGMKQVIYRCFSMLSFQSPQMDENASLPEELLTFTTDIAEQSMQAYLKDNGNTADPLSQLQSYKATRFGFICPDSDNMNA